MLNPSNVDQSRLPLSSIIMMMNPDIDLTGLPSSGQEIQDTKADYCRGDMWISEDWTNRTFHNPPGNSNSSSSNKISYRVHDVLSNSRSEMLYRVHIVLKVTAVTYVHVVQNITAGYLTLFEYTAPVRSHLLRNDILCCALRFDFWLTQTSHKHGAGIVLECKLHPT